MPTLASGHAQGKSGGEQGPGNSSTPSVEQRWGPHKREDAERGGLGIDDERGGWDAERDSQRRHIQSLLDTDFKRVYLFLPIQFLLQRLLEML